MAFIHKPQSPFATWFGTQRNTMVTRSAYGPRTGTGLSGHSCTALIALTKAKSGWRYPVDLDDASARSLKRAPKGAGILNLTVQGVFVSGGTFGHSNGYRFKIIAHKIRDVAVIQKGTKSPTEEERAE